MRLEWATEEHMNAVADLIRASYEQYRDKLVPPSGGISETEETLREKLVESRCLLASEGTALLGCVWLRPDGDAIYFHRLAVLPEHRGKGLGRTLVTRVESLAIDEGFGKTRLACRILAPENIAFYQKLGYERTCDGPMLHEGKVFYILMEKTLPSLAS